LDQRLEQVESPPAEPAGDAAPESPALAWYHRLGRLLFFVISLEVGIFLVVFPWLPEWSDNFFSSLTRGSGRFWANHYLRGAVSGIGLVNIVISFQELLVLIGVLPWRKGGH
jgi:hypothetical protein